MRLGDKVERLAKPIATAIDAALGTDIKHCSGCQKRKAFLNGESLTNEFKHDNKTQSQ